MGGKDKNMIPSYSFLNTDKCNILALDLLVLELKSACIFSGLNIVDAS